LCHSLSSKQLRVALVAVHDLSRESKIVSLTWDKCFRDLSLDVEVFDAFLSPATLIAMVARILDQQSVESTSR
jgi:hypothetical protein